MIKLYDKGIYLSGNNEIIAEEQYCGNVQKEEAKKAPSHGPFLRLIIRQEIWINLKSSLIR